MQENIETCVWGTKIFEPFIREHNVSKIHAVRLHSWSACMRDGCFVFQNEDSSKGAQKRGHLEMLPNPNKSTLSLKLGCLVLSVQHTSTAGSGSKLELQQGSALPRTPDEPLRPPFWKLPKVLWWPFKAAKPGNEKSKLGQNSAELMRDSISAEWRRKGGVLRCLAGHFPKTRRNWLLHQSFPKAS